MAMTTLQKKHTDLASCDTTAAELLTVMFKKYGLDYSQNDEKWILFISDNLREIIIILREFVYNVEPAPHFLL